MSDAILEYLRGLMSSPWIYVALFGLSMFDAFVPIFPSESLVVTAGVFAHHGKPWLPLVILTAWVGAFCGDHVSYFIGRYAGGWLERVWLRPGSRRRKAYDEAGRILDKRGGLVLLIARYIPGGRTAATLVMGAVGYPLHSFSLFDALATGLWATYSAMIGYLGGAAFQNDPFKGLLLGLGIAVGVSLLVEAGRWLWQRFRPAGRNGGDRQEADKSTEHRTR
ncbi:DedA family protein [Actinomadura verrucosospora]|uniref:DedA family membrane protein n=1 Tax=Actinomadura verrucosospora TaxID=46165 RepID=A0A7D4A6M3_ACTVE|nr:DedA family protein [Actinomadura verrucosospora]QKG22347.1 DedA family membrane protein [Actinomadura verrucosospora]